MWKFVGGLVVGVVVLGAARFAATPWPEPTHYHANWSLFVHGEPMDLSADWYMEEVGACVAGESIVPSQRVHMHEGEDHVVHVHHDGVTWGHFLTNLEFVLGDDFLVLDDGRRLADGEAGTLKFVVDGFALGDIANRVIESGDRLLISYGPESVAEVTEEQFPRVPSDAGEYNERQDPAGCAGSAEPTFMERLRMAFWG